ncbi:hypothetical protein [Nocardioides sp. GY 10127]|uniref:hypothetical protein n=1 Tax=Nocardioides sp. GY 10127 TaxID=2569762 RepID=UPI00145875AF|nr:hypothetical protein [Nocardioides sp. GY 10127]
MAPGVLLLVVALLALAGSPARASGSVAQRTTEHRRVTTWAPVADATITPGVQLYTRGAQCTASFVLTDAAGHVYLGYAAHCAAGGESTDTDGCTVRTYRYGTRVRVASGGSLLTGGTTLARGRLAWSSWRAMQASGGDDAAACAGNDLALVRLPTAAVAHVNPSVPVWGGPTGLGAAPAEGDAVFSYGASSLRAGQNPLSPRTGQVLAPDPSTRGWTLEVMTATPGVPGDSGSGFLDAEGRAVGTLSTLAVLPVPGSNGVSALARALDWAAAHGAPAGLRLVPGTEPFTGVAPAAAAGLLGATG